MNAEALRLLRDVQSKDDEEVALQNKSARYRNSDKKLFESVVARVEHVISELLQNADDAEASKVRLDYTDGVLTFQHDGKDFADDQFRSICSFAVSSKHTFKTTGFRGIGFKSTFSLGDAVRLITPRFQVKFELPRFTFPVELTDESADADFAVTIRVPVKERSRRELESSLKAWRTAPCSLLFFHNLKGGVTIGPDHFVVCRPETGNSLNTITRNGQKIWEGHLISVPNIQLPKDACEEIANLRGAAVESETGSTTQLDILINKNEAGRIYSILPTSSERRLQTPFALNGSFVLTPERDGIKSPSQSPTNRFLFAEAGRIVADQLLQELEAASDITKELLRTYDLLPLKGSFDKPDAETEASRELRAACLERLKEQNWVVTVDRNAICPGKVKLVELPSALVEVWPPETLRKLFAPDASIAHPQLPESVVKWLKDNRHLIQPANDDLLRALTKPEIPRPERKEQLFALWTWAARTIITHGVNIDAQTRPWSSLNILPTEGETRLNALGKVYHFSKATADVFKIREVNLSELGLYRLDTDLVTPEDLKLQNPPQEWWTMMECSAVAITGESNFAHILANATRVIVSQENGKTFPLSALKALWLIHQEFAIPLAKDLPVLRENGKSISISQRQLILRSESVDVSRYVPADWLAELSLATEWYPKAPSDRNEFCQWLIQAGSAMYLPRPGPINSGDKFRHEVELYASKLGGHLNTTKGASYAYLDFEWHRELTTFWETQSVENPTLFEEIAKLAVEHHGGFLRSRSHVVFYRIVVGNWTPITSNPLLACGWARYFRDKPCLRSTSGELRKPSELYILKPNSTALLINAGEPAISPQLQDAYGEELLAILGCRNALPGLSELTRLIRAELDTGTKGPDRISWLLRAANDVFRYCIDTGEKEKLLELLTDRPSIPSSSGKLERPDDLVQERGEDSDVRVVATELRGTPIIVALGVRQSPSRLSDIGWIDTEIAVGVSLPREKLRKLKKLLSQPSSVSEHLWSQRKWLALDATVRSLDDLDFWHSDIKELPSDNIVALNVKARTADFSVISPLPQELRSFSKPCLLNRLQSELHIGDVTRNFDCEWLPAIGHVLWTEALNAGDYQTDLEKTSTRWKNAKVALTPGLSRRFTLDGAVVATAIEVIAAWASENCFVIRANDEDEICDLTAEIAFRLREPIVGIRTKTGPKLSGWITRSETQVTKLGIKALEVLSLRPWPSTGPEEVVAVTDTEETKESPESDTAGKPTAAHLSIPPRGDGAAERKNASGEKDGSETHDTETRQREGPGRQQAFVDDDNGAPVRGDGGKGDDQGALRLRSHRSYAEGVGSRESRGTSHPTRSREGFTPSPQSPDRMLSYVEHSLDRRERERQRSEAKEAGDAAEEFVIAWERKAGREAQRQKVNNAGYDIVSNSDGGTETRYIEVKSIAGAWGGTGVRLSPPQFAHAETLGDKYWLYVVEDAKTTHPIVHAIQDPAAHISAFCFDCGWREIAEKEAGGKPASAFIPKVGDTVIFGEHDVVVEKVETRGAFVLVTFTFDDRPCRKMNTALLPKV